MIKFEIGKKYLQRNGDIVTCSHIVDTKLYDDSFPIHLESPDGEIIYTNTIEGKYWNNCNGIDDWDIVDYAPDDAPGDTLDNYQPGESVGEPKDESTIFQVGDLVTCDKYGDGEVVLVTDTNSLVVEFATDNHLWNFNNYGQFVGSETDTSRQLTLISRKATTHLNDYENETKTSSSTDEVGREKSRKEICVAFISEAYDLINKYECVSNKAAIFAALCDL